MVKNFFSVVAIVFALACFVPFQSEGSPRGIRRNPRGKPGPAPEFSASGNFSTPQAYTLPGVPVAPYCITADVSATQDWADNATAGIWGIGQTWSSNDSISMFRRAGNSQVQWDMQLWGHTGGSLECWSAASYPDGYATYPSHRISYCYETNNHWYVYQDNVRTSDCGAQPAGGINLTTDFEIGATIGGGFASGSNSPPTKVCISPGNGNATGDPKLDVKNSCGQWTSPTRLPLIDGCYGCMGTLPNVGAEKVLAIGDSITFAGLFNPRTYPGKLQQLLGANYDVTNAGVGGSTLSQMKSQYDSTYHSAALFSRCILQGGVNDIMRDGASAASTYATASALLDEMRTDGCFPIVVKPLPAGNASGGGFSWDTTKQAEYEAYRSDLDGYCSAHGILCLETYSVFGDGGSPVQYLSQYDSGDHVHPNQAGTDKLADMIYKAGWEPYALKFTNAHTNGVTPTFATDFSVDSTFDFWIAIVVQNAIAPGSHSAHIEWLLPSGSTFLTYNFNFDMSTNPDGQRVWIPSSYPLSGSIIEQFSLYGTHTFKLSIDGKVITNGDSPIPATVNLHF